jgi:hypothetical protein
MSFFHSNAAQGSKKMLMELPSILRYRDPRKTLLLCENGLTSKKSRKTLRNPRNMSEICCQNTLNYEIKNKYLE